MPDTDRPARSPARPKQSSDALAAPAYGGTFALYYLLAPAKGKLPWGVYWRLGNRLDRLGHAPEAIAAFRTCLEKAPHRPGPRQRLAALHARCQQWDAAAQVYRELAEAAPDAAGFLRLGHLHFQRQQWRPAIAAYQAARSRGLSPQAQEEVAVNLAEAYFETQQWGKAIAAYPAAIAIRPDDPRLFDRLGRCFLAQKRWAEAIAPLQASLALDDTRADTHHRLGRAYSQCEDWQRAIVCYERARAAGARFSGGDATRTPELDLRAAEALRRLKRWAEAAAAYERALNPTAGKADREKSPSGTAKSQASKSKDSKSKTSKSKDSKSKDSKSKDSKSKTSELKTSELKTSKTQFPNSAYLHWLEALERAKLWKDFVPAARLAIARMPDRPDLHDRLARVQRRLGRKSEAIATCERALELDSASAKRWRTLAEWCGDCGNWERAAAAWAEVQAREPEDAWIAYQRGRACHQIGQLDAAIAAYDRALLLQRCGAIALTETGLAETGLAETGASPTPDAGNGQRDRVREASPKAIRIVSPAEASPPEHRAEAPNPGPLEPWQVEAHCALADLRSDRGDWTDAIGHYQTLADWEALSPERRERWVAALVALERWADARQVAQGPGAVAGDRPMAAGDSPLERLSPSETLRERDRPADGRLVADCRGEAEAALVLGNALARQRRWEAAAAAYREARERQPANPQAIAALGNACAALGQWEAAADAYAQALQRGWDAVEGGWRWGRVLARQQRWREAVDAFELAREAVARREGERAAVRAASPGEIRAPGIAAIAPELPPIDGAGDDPDDPAAAIETLLAEARIARDRGTDEVAFYREAVAQRPKRVHLWRKLGHALTLRCGVQPAEWEAVDEALASGFGETDNDTSQMHNRRTIPNSTDGGGDSAAVRRDLAEAAEAYRRMLLLDPLKSTRFYRILKVLYLRLDRPADWLNTLADLQARYPDNRWIAAEYWQAIGEYRARQGDWYPAIASYLRALQFQPDRIPTYNAIQVLLPQVGIDTLPRSATSPSSFCELPSDLVESVLELPPDWQRPAAEADGVCLWPLHPPGEVILQPSRTIRAEPLPELAVDRVAVPPAAVAIVPNGRVWASQLQTATFAANGQLLSDLSTGPAAIAAAASDLPPPREFDGTVAFLGARWTRYSYFHWMFDVVPRLALLRQCDAVDWDAIAAFAFNGCGQPFHRETLARFGIAPERCLETCDTWGRALVPDPDWVPHLRARSLVVPAIPELRAYRGARWACETLREIFLEPVPPAERDRYPRRLAIDRRSARYRHLANGDAASDRLAAWGFESVDLADLSVAEQARHLACAEAVFAVHGGGLTNLAFCSPGTKVVEVFPPGHRQNTYWILSNVCGLEHYHALAESVGDASERGVKRDLVLDPDRIDALLALALGE